MNGGRGSAGISEVARTRGIGANASKRRFSLNLSGTGVGARSQLPPRRTTHAPSDNNSGSQIVEPGLTILNNLAADDADTDVHLLNEGHSRTAMLKPLRAETAARC